MCLRATRGERATQGGCQAVGGCGGGDAPAAAPASTTVSGDVVKGPVNGATVTFKRPDGSVIGTTTTDTSATMVSVTCAP